jgi:hypothetical protein
MNFKIVNKEITLNYCKSCYTKFTVISNILTTNIFQEKYLFKFKINF